MAMNKRKMQVKSVIVEFCFEKQMTIYMKIVKIRLSEKVNSTINGCENKVEISRSKG